MACVIMEAEKPHDLPSVSWRPRITMIRFSLNQKASDPGEPMIAMRVQWEKMRSDVSVQS